MNNPGNQSPPRGIPLVLALAFCLSVMIGCITSLPQDCRGQEMAVGTVEEVLSLYDQGRLQEAELVALRLLQSSEKLPPVDRGLLYKTLGFIYVAAQENEKAISQFISWLEIDPLANLDPIYVSPKIIAVFEQARAELSERRKQILPVDNIELSFQVKAIKRSLLFPGLGQIYRGEKTKGFALMGSELVLLGALIYSHVQYDKYHDEYLHERNPSHMQDLYDQANFYYRARAGAAILAAAVYLYSLFDAAYIQPPRRTEPSLSITTGSRSDRLVVLSIRF